MLSQKQIRWSIAQLEILIPNAVGALNSRTPFELLIAVILSAQATDISVNKVTPQLFADFPTPKAMAAASIQAIEADIHTIGLFHNKAKYLKSCAQQLMTDFAGEVPNDRSALESLAGVGHKTASVVLGDAFAVPAFAVDTHVARIAKRLRIVPQKASVNDVEAKVTAALPKEDWIQAHHTLILFGRQVCTARNPKCDSCPLLSICAQGQQRMAQKKTTRQ